MDYSRFYMFDNGERIHIPDYKKHSPFSNRDSYHYKVATIDKAQELQARSSNQTSRYVQHYLSGKNKKQKERALKVYQIMNKPVRTIDAEATIKEAWQIFCEHNFHHFPVLKDNKLCGIVSDRDLLKHNSYLTEKHLAENTPIREIMHEKILACNERTSIREAADFMFRCSAGSILVIDREDNLLGIVTRTDILKSLIHQAPLELWI